MRLPGGRLAQFCKVAPPGRFTRARILAVLLPGRALPAFRRGWAPLLADLGWRADVDWEAAAWPFFAAALAFWGGLGFPTALAVAWAGSRFSVVDVVIVHAPLAVITAVTTWITPKRSHGKRSLWKFGKGDGMAMGAGKRGRSWHCAMSRVSGPLTVLAPAPGRCTGRANLGAGFDPN